MRPFKTLLTICCVVTLGGYLAVSMRLPVLPLYASGLDITTAQVGVINSAFYLFAGLLSIPSGILSDLFGRRRLALVGTTVLCAGMLLLYTGRTFVQLTGLYILLGGGIAAFGPTMMAWVAEIAPPTHLGRAYGWYTTALFCGLSFGPAVGGALGQWWALRPVFLVAGGLIAVNFWAILRFLPDPSGKRGGKEDGTSRRGKIGKILSNRPLIGCWAVTFGCCVIGGMFFSFLPLHAKNQGLAVGRIGMVFFVQALTNALSRIPFGAFSDRVAQRKHLVLAGAVLVTLCITGFAPARTLSHFLIAGIGLGVSMAVAFTSIGALIAETVEPAFRGLAMGGYNTCIYLGMMSGSIGLGPVIESMGFGPGFVLAGMCNIPFIAVFVLFMRRYRSLKTPDEKRDTRLPS